MRLEKNGSLEGDVAAALTIGDTLFRLAGLEHATNKRIEAAAIPDQRCIGPDYRTISRFQ